MHGGEDAREDAGGVPRQSPGDEECRQDTEHAHEELHDKRGGRQRGGGSEPGDDLVQAGDGGDVQGARVEAPGADRRVGVHVATDPVDHGIAGASGAEVIPGVAQPEITVEVTEVDMLAAVCAGVGQLRSQAARDRRRGGRELRGVSVDPLLGQLVGPREPRLRSGGRGHLAAETLLQLAARNPVGPVLDGPERTGERPDPRDHGHGQQHEPSTRPVTASDARCSTDSSEGLAGRGEVWGWLPRAVSRSNRRAPSAFSPLRGTSGPRRRWTAGTCANCAHRITGDRAAHPERRGTRRRTYPRPSPTASARASASARGLLRRTDPAFTVDELPTTSKVSEAR